MNSSGGERASGVTGQDAGEGDDGAPASCGLTLRGQGSGEREGRRRGLALGRRGVDRGVNPLLQFGGGGRRLRLVSSRLRGIAAEIEGVAAFGREVGFWNEAGLADGVWPRLPAVAATLGGFFVVTGDGGVGGVVAVPDVPAGGKVGIGVEENEVIPITRRF